MSLVESFLPKGMFAITPSDTNSLPEMAFGLICKTAGTLHYVTAKGQEYTDTVAAGEEVKCQVSKVFATGTTVTVRGYQLN
jgi:hypothetical protein